jgi:hypothetical protein
MPELKQRPLLDEGGGRDPNRWWAASGRKDWCTPDRELALVRRVFGDESGLRDIDGDPCSNPASRTGALREWMLERGENGLAAPWRGAAGAVGGVVVRLRKWFVNPPYGEGEIAPFVSKARMEWSRDRNLLIPAGVGADECILLVPANTETSWYHRDCAVADALCFRKGRIQFRDPSTTILQGKRSQSTVSNLWVYWGPRPEWFASVFEGEGHAFVTRAGRERR